MGNRTHNFRATSVDPCKLTNFLKAMGQEAPGPSPYIHNTLEIYSNLRIFTIHPAAFTFSKVEKSMFPLHSESIQFFLADGSSRGYF